MDRGGDSPYHHEQQQQGGFDVSRRVFSSGYLPLDEDRNRDPEAVFNEFGSNTRQAVYGHDEVEIIQHALTSNTSSLRRRKQVRVVENDYDDINSDIDIPEEENELETKKAHLNSMFGIMPFAGMFM